MSQSPLPPGRRPEPERYGRLTFSLSMLFFAVVLVDNLESNLLKGRRICFVFLFFFNRNLKISWGFYLFHLWERKKMYFMINKTKPVQIYFSAGYPISMASHPTCNLKGFWFQFNYLKVDTNPQLQAPFMNRLSLPCIQWSLFVWNEIKRPGFNLDTTGFALVDQRTSLVCVHLRLRTLWFSYHLATSKTDADKSHTDTGLYVSVHVLLPM